MEIYFYSSLAYHLWSLSRHTNAVTELQFKDAITITSIPLSISNRYDLWDVTPRRWKHLRVWWEFRSCRLSSEETPSPLYGSLISQLKSRTNTGACRSSVLLRWLNRNKCVKRVQIGDPRIPSAGYNLWQKTVGVWREHLFANTVRACRFTLRWLSF